MYALRSCGYFTIFVIFFTDKVKKKYANLSDGGLVVMVQLERGKTGLGLSLAGHRDRSRMAVFVCGLRPGGAAQRHGGVQLGDEILEVSKRNIQNSISFNYVTCYPKPYFNRKVYVGLLQNF